MNTYTTCWKHPASTFTTCNLLRTATTSSTPRRRLKFDLPNAPTVNDFFEKAKTRSLRQSKERQAALDEASSSIPTFSQKLRENNQWPLKRDAPTTMQINIGKFCNLNCRHCHVESGPTKTQENMNYETVQRCLTLLAASPSIDTVDITGGAPELNPHFRMLVKEARAMGKSVIDRCNLAVLFERGQEDLAPFLSEQGVNIVASLPCYTSDNVDKQRGKRVFDDSITALKLLNAQGFGRQSDSTSHRLDLVYNPGGATLPPAQAGLETEYRRRLKDDHDITFNSVFTLTNMPIKRFADTLYQTGQYSEYMQVLANAFNASTVSALMCRFTVNVAWDGKLFDCDFNAALDMGSKSPSRGGADLDIWNVDNLMELGEGIIRTQKHCFGCTAGSGSSCGGALT